MADTRGELIKLAAQLITSCPISSYIADWHLPKYVSAYRLCILQRELDAFDSWRKDMCVKISQAARTIEAANTSPNS
jgi:hypothetical protein